MRMSDWSSVVCSSDLDGEQWRGIEPEADPGHVERSVALAQALGSHHVKTRTFRRWAINARIIEAAHRRGMRATGHCAHPLPVTPAQIRSTACRGRGCPKGWISGGAVSFKNKDT